MPPRIFNHPPRDQHHHLNRHNFLKSHPRKHTRFKIATWNVRGGLRHTLKCDQILNDMRHHNIAICALQETKAKDICHLSHPYGRILGFPSTNPHYGLAFAISNNLQVHSAESISDRIAVLRLFLNNNRYSDIRPSLITVINVYAPTSERTRNFPDETELFYQQLNLVTHKYRYSSLFFIAGDFNAKIGHKLNDTESFMGSYGKHYGSRNYNGNLLASFTKSNRLFLSNTAFNHSSRHISTWHGRIGGNRVLHNQIDYILCSHPIAQLLVNARSYRGTTAESDHSLVVTTLNLAKYHQQLAPLQRQKKAPPIIQHRALSEDGQIRLDYQAALRDLLEDQPIDAHQSPNDQWATLRNLISTAAQATLPLSSPFEKPHPQYSRDPLIQQYSSRLRELRQVLFNHPRNLIPPPGFDRAHLVYERTQIKRLLLKRQFHLHNARLDRIAHQLDHCTNQQAAHQFELTRILQHNKTQPFQLRTADHHPILTPQAQSDAIRTHYEQFFNQPQYDPVQMWISPIPNFTALISPPEVEFALGRLSNGRCKDSEGVYSEFLKYSANVISHPLSVILNTIFTTQTPLTVMQVSELFCLNKGKGVATVTNLRPITLMSIVRKVLEIIVLLRIYAPLDEYISINQSARRFRGTSDIIWTYKFFDAYADRFNQHVHILGQDIEKAFDSVNRNKLLAILEPLIPPDSLTMIRYLMSETQLTVKLGTTKSTPFFTTHGIPQGGALSTVLFCTYVEAPLRQVRALIPEIILDERALTIDTEYVDDADFLSTDANLPHQLQLLMPGIFAPWDLRIHPDKTEHHHLHRRAHNTNHKKLGVNMNTQIDITNKFIKATAAFKKLYSLWFRAHHVQLSTRIKIYNAYIPPILTYNLHATGLTQRQLNSLDSFHRKQLRIIMRIFHPNKISNKALYRDCSTAPISTMIQEQRLRLFGHILRRPADSPPHRAMEAYFSPDNKAPRGRCLTNLPSMLNSEFSAHTAYQLRNLTDFNFLRAYAANRTNWDALSLQIINGTKKKFDQNRKRRRQIADLPDEPPLEAPNLRKLTPPGLDYRKRNISQLGAPYNEWYPSSRRQRRILADPIPQNNINPHLE